MTNTALTTHSLIVKFGMEARRKLVYEEGGRMENSADTALLLSAAQKRMRENEELVARLEGKLAGFEIEARRANERWGSVVKENKLLAAR